MSTPAVRESGEIAERPATGPGRELGQKRKAQLRLALGYKDTARRGAPVKTEYFIPHGEDPIVEKFVTVYGDEPKSIDIRLPSSMGAFLDIRHVAFAGGQSEGGGILKAIGSVNFALEGTLGGPDRLTVFSTIEVPDGKGKTKPQLQSEEILIEDVDDPAAKELGVYLQATVTFGIPDVLGFGGVCEVRSRGKETIDTLWETACDIYNQLGAHASMILRPKLILKPSTMLTPRGQKASLYVVDLYVPESLDEVMGRLREMRQLLPGGAAAAMYGGEMRPAFGVLASGPVAMVPVDEEFVPHEDDGSQQAEPGQPPRSGSAPGNDDDFDDASAEDGVDIAAAAESAGEFVVTTVKNDNWAYGLTIQQIAQQEGDRPALFFGWALRQSAPDELLWSVRAYIRVHFADLYEQMVESQS